MKDEKIPQPVLNLTAVCFQHRTLRICRRELGNERARQDAETHPASRPACRKAAAGWLARGETAGAILRAMPLPSRPENAFTRTLAASGRAHGAAHAWRGKSRAANE